jgi:hypothetical protein
VEAYDSSVGVRHVEAGAAMELMNTAVPNPEVVAAVGDGPQGFQRGHFKREQVESR